MVEQRYNAVYTQRVEMHEFANSIIEGDKTALPCIIKVQRDLFEKGILPFEVNSVNDLSKVNKLPLGDVHNFLRYVYLAYRYVEEEWYWDDKLQQYVSKNSYWSQAY